MAIRLFEADHRDSGDYRPMPTVYKVCKGPRLSENSAFVREVDGEVRRSGSYQELFGELLEEEHPTRTIEARGERMPVRRYEVYWSAVERYEPRSAGQLGAGRVAREGRALEREERERPLFAE